MAWQRWSCPCPVQSPYRQCIQAQWSHLIGLPVPEEVDRAIQASLDDSPTPRVMSLVTPHLHQAVGILRLHQVDGAGAVTILQGLQAISPWTCRQVFECYNCLLPGYT